MKHSMLKVGLALTSISILIVTILLFSAFRDTTPQDIDEIRFSIIGAYETQVQMGMFTSPERKKFFFDSRRVKHSVIAIRRKS